MTGDQSQRIIGECPRCHKKCAGTAAHVGKTLKCPHCQHPFTFGPLAAAQQAAPAKPSPSASLLMCGECMYLGPLEDRGKAPRTCPRCDSGGVQVVDSSAQIMRPLRTNKGIRELPKNLADVSRLPVFLSHCFDCGIYEELTSKPAEMRERPCPACRSRLTLTIAREDLDQFFVAEAVNSQGEKRFEARDYAGAAERFRKGYGIRPDHPYGILDLGNALCMLGKERREPKLVEEGMAHLAEGTRLFPHFTRMQDNLRMAQEQLPKMKRDAAAAVDITKIQPRSAAQVLSSAHDAGVATDVGDIHPASEDDVIVDAEIVTMDSSPRGHGISAICPYCTHVFAVMAESAGTKVDCPVCQRPYTIQPATEDDDEYRLAPDRSSPETKRDSFGPDPGFLSAEDQRILAGCHGYDFVEINQVQVDPTAARLVLGCVARELKVLPISRSRGELIVAMADPLVDVAKLASVLGRRVRPVLAYEPDLITTIERQGQLSGTSILETGFRTFLQVRPPARYDRLPDRRQEWATDHKVWIAFQEAAIHGAAPSFPRQLAEESTTEPRAQALVLLGVTCSHLHSDSLACWFNWLSAANVEPPFSWLLVLERMYSSNGAKLVSLLRQREGKWHSEVIEAHTLVCFDCGQTQDVHRLFSPSDRYPRYGWPCRHCGSRLTAFDTWGDLSSLRLAGNDVDRILELWAELYPDDASGQIPVLGRVSKLLGRATEELANGDHRAAVTASQLALKLMPSHPNVLYVWAVINCAYSAAAQDRKMLELGIFALEGLLKVYPNFREARRLRNLARVRLERFDPVLLEQGLARIVAGSRLFPDFPRRKEDVPRQQTKAVGSQRATNAAVQAVPRTAASDASRASSQRRDCVCDVCNAPMAWEDGYVLATKDVVTAPGYWKYVLSHQWAYYHDVDPTGSSLATLVLQQAGQESGWLICQRCSDMFSFDRPLAKQLAQTHSSTVPGGGRASATEVGSVAGRAWQELYDQWPASVERSPCASSPTPLIRFSTMCPHCHRGFSAPADYAGKTVPCPACQEPFQCQPISEPSEELNLAPISDPGSPVSLAWDLTDSEMVRVALASKEASGTAQGISATGSRRPLDVQELIVDRTQTFFAAAVLVLLVVVGIPAAVIALSTENWGVVPILSLVAIVGPAALLTFYVHNSLEDRVVQLEEHAPVVRCDQCHKPIGVWQGFVFLADVKGAVERAAREIGLGGLSAPENLPGLVRFLFCGECAAKAVIRHQGRPAVVRWWLHHSTGSKSQKSRISYEAQMGALVGLGALAFVVEVVILIAFFVRGSEPSIVATPSLTVPVPANSSASSSPSSDAPAAASEPTTRPAEGAAKDSPGTVWKDTLEETDPSIRQTGEDDARSAMDPSGQSPEQQSEGLGDNAQGPGISSTAELPALAGTVWRSRKGSTFTAVTPNRGQLLVVIDRQGDQGEVEGHFEWPDIGERNTFVGAISRDGTGITLTEHRRPELDTGLATSDVVPCVYSAELKQNEISGTWKLGQEEDKFRLELLSAASDPFQAAPPQRVSLANNVWKGSQENAAGSPETIILAVREHAGQWITLSLEEPALGQKTILSGFVFADGCTLGFTKLGGLGSGGGFSISRADAAYRLWYKAELREGEMEGFRQVGSDDRQRFRLRLLPKSFQQVLKGTSWKGEFQVQSHDETSSRSAANARVFLAVARELGDRFEGTIRWGEMVCRFQGIIFSDGSSVSLAFPVEASTDGLRKSRDALWATHKCAAQIHGDSMSGTWSDDNGSSGTFSLTHGESTR